MPVVLEIVTDCTGSLGSSHTRLAQKEQTPMMNIGKKEGKRRRKGMEGEDVVVDTCGPSVS